MNVKIQGGGGGVHANTGSCSDLVDYLEHEDKKQIEQGKEIEPFFNHREERVNPNEIIKKIDQNKGGVGSDQAKFFVVTISPNEKEILSMGATPEEQSRNFKDFIKNEFADKYAQNFTVKESEKDLKKEDLMYYSKIHLERKGKRDNDMHAHIIVSRKTIDNIKKISPQTNHKGTSKGVVRGGFNRVNFFKNVETSFDEKFNYNRDIKETFDYQNTMKNGTVKEIEAQLLKEKAQEKSKELTQVKEQKQQQNQNKNLNRSL